MYAHRIHGLIALLVVSLWHVNSIGHIHAENCFDFLNSVSTFTQNVKAYNQFVSLNTYQLEKLTIISCVAKFNNTLDISKTFYCYYLIEFYEMEQTSPFMVSPRFDI